MRVEYWKQAHDEGVAQEREEILLGVLKICESSFLASRIVDAVAFIRARGGPKEIDKIPDENGSVDWRVKLNEVIDAVNALRRKP